MTKAQKFAKKFVKLLDQDHWGEIPQECWEMIASQDFPDTEEGEWANALHKILEQCLAEENDD